MHRIIVYVFMAVSIFFTYSDKGFAEGNKFTEQELQILKRQFEFLRSEVVLCTGVVKQSNESSNQFLIYNQMQCREVMDAYKQKRYEYYKYFYLQNREK